jgi:branched-chain amino acid transport system substrate-binding protein
MGFLASAQADSLTARQATKSPICIGQIVALTGIYAEPGRPPAYWKAGARLAVREINAHGGIHGRPLKLVYADTGTTPDFSGDIAAFRKLAASGKVTAIIGENFSPAVQALTPAIKRDGIPTIIGGQAPILTHEGNPWVFRTRVNQRVEARVLATFAVSTLHLSRIAIIGANNVAGKEARALLRANLKKLGVKPVTDQVTPQLATDLTEQALAIKKSGAKGLISIFTDFSDYVVLARQMNQAGVHLIWIGNPVMSAESTRLQAGALLYGTYAATDYAAGQSPEATSFDTLSKSVYHLPGDQGSAWAYDGVQILARVMGKVGTNPQAIRRGILALRGYRGVMGTYNFDRNGDGLRQETIVQNVHGRLHVVKVLSF